MPGAAELSFVLDLLIIVLSVAFAYLVYTKLVNGMLNPQVPVRARDSVPPIFSQEPPAGFVQAGPTVNVTIIPPQETVSGMLDERLRLKRLVTDLKKKFLQGKLSENDFKLLSQTYSNRFKAVNRKLKLLGVTA